MNNLKIQLADLFLQYINDFLTLQSFASFYGMSESSAKKLIDVGRDFHEERVEIMRGKK